MNPFCIPHADQVGHIALFQLQQFKERAKECLRHEDFGNAFHYYNEAVKHCNVFAHFPNVQEEQPKLLSNRSMVLSKTGHFELALTDAQQCIGMKPFWEKGYWRAATAYKGLNNMYEALNMLIQGYNATLPQRNQGIIIDFLQEIIITIIDPLVNRYQGDCYFLLANLEHNIESLGAEVQEKILQRLASSQQWEGISLLVTGVHRGPESFLDYSFTNVSAEKISVGCLLKDLSITDLKGYGMQLAAALLKNGASYQDIELKWGSPVLHVVLVKTLETGNEELMKLILRKYLDTQDKKNVVDTYGHSALHVITQFRPCCDERNKLLSICIESGCNAFIFDKSEKLSIDYCEPNDKCFESLSRIFGDTDTVRKHVVGLKEKGNTAKEEKQYEQALLYYSRAINLSTRCDSLQRDSAMLYTNRCTVYSEQNNLQEAIKDAELAIKIDNTWIKGHWRKTQLLRRIGQNLEAFSAAVVGLSISEVAQKEKCELVVECVKSFQYLTDSEKKEKYTTFSDIPVQFWPSVLQKLSKETEWLCIKQLVLGIEQNNDEVKGIARDTDFSTIRYDNLFAFIIGQHNLETVSSWIVPLIIHITTKPEGSNNLMRFKEWEGDTPLHAAAKFSILTGNAALLRYMEEISKKVNIYDGLKNSPLHSIVKMPRPSQIDIFPEVVEMLLHFGVSADLLDKEGKTAVDYIDQAKYPRIFEILERKSNELKAPQTDEESSEKNSQMTENNQGKGSVLTSSNRGKDRSIKREITKNTANPQHQEQVKTCDSLSSNNTTELVTNEFETSKNEGDRMFKERKYESALKSYRKAKEFMKIAKDSEVISIFCKMADCYLNFEQFKKIIEESKHFISFLGNSFQAQFRIGKAYAGLRQHSVAVKTFCIAYGLTNANHDDLLYELAKTYTSCNFKESKRQLDMQEKKDERRQDLKTFQLQMKAEKEKRVEQKKLERKRRFNFVKNF
ncbi:uncharacterized protein LOC134266763 [Saccostrea cucullata]|uniref:uncharacterized protein LOC134266763 n=1 Tax=Saccostrea cuccullata TaxID=36930 RepID=UPI002ED54BAD